MEHLRRAHELFERSRDDRGIASTLDDMGRVNWLRGAFGQALDFHRQALTIRRALGDRRSIALSLANIGRVHHDTGNFKAAINQFREALDLRRDIGDLVGVVQSLCDLGGVHAEDGNHELALELLGEARTMAQRHRRQARARRRAVARRRGQGGDGPRRGGGQGSVARPSALASGLGDRVALATAHQRLAHVQLQLGNLEAADIEAHAAVAVSEAVGLRVHIGCGYRVKAEVAAALGQTAQAEDDFRRAIDILAAVKHEVELARAYQGLADGQGARRAGRRGDEAAPPRRRHLQPAARRRGHRDRVAMPCRCAELGERLAAAVPANVRAVCQTLAAAGHQAVAVGGAVRDAMLGRAPGDWDVATSARPEQVMALFKRTVPTGLAARHGHRRDRARRGLARRGHDVPRRGRVHRRAAARSRHVRRAAGRGPRAPRPAGQRDRLRPGDRRR